MAYTSSSGPGNEVTKLRDEITHEVNTDAEHIADSVFGKLGSMPDMRRVSDEELAARYRAAYTNNDRQWLIGEAHRDPEQFVKVARQIGVQLPEEIGQEPQVFPTPVAPVAPPPPAVPAAPAPPPPPEVMPAAVPVAPTPAPVLGNIAQHGQTVPYTVPPGI